MEHPCYKCGANVEDGTPFCPQCAAPQIRVAGPEPHESAAASPEDTISLSASAGALPTVMEWPAAWLSAISALLAAVFLILLGTPAGLAMLAAGILCVILYRRRCRMGHLTLGMGAKLGALVGALGSAILAAILGLAAAFGFGPQIHETFLKALQEYAARSSDPRLPQVMELTKTSEGFAVLLTLALAATLVAFLIFSTLGGALGALLLRRKDRL